MGLIKSSVFFWGPKAREEAVQEMLLRLRWDRRDNRARLKLSKIVAQIWDGLEGISPLKPLTSALWIADEADKMGAEKSDTSLPDFVTITASQADATVDNESVTTTEAAWSVV